MMSMDQPPQVVTLIKKLLDMGTPRADSKFSKRTTPTSKKQGADGSKGPDARRERA